MVFYSNPRHCYNDTCPFSEANVDSSMCNCSVCPHYKSQLTKIELSDSTPYRYDELEARLFEDIFDEQKDLNFYDYEIEYLNTLDKEVKGE